MAVITMLRNLNNRRIKALPGKTRMKKHDYRHRLQQQYLQQAKNLQQAPLPEKPPQPKPGKLKRFIEWLKRQWSKKR